MSLSENSYCILEWHGICKQDGITRITLSMGAASEIRCYNVTSSLIDWVHTHTLPGGGWCYLVVIQLSCIILFHFSLKMVWILKRKPTASWFRNFSAVHAHGLILTTAPSHYLNQCWNIVNWIPRSKFQWKLPWNSYIFIQEKSYWKFRLQKGGISSRPHCLNS